MIQVICNKCKSVNTKKPTDPPGCALCGYMSETQETKLDPKWNDLLKWLEEYKKTKEYQDIVELEKILKEVPQIPDINIPNITYYCSQCGKPTGGSGTSLTDFCQCYNFPWTITFSNTTLLS